MRQELEEKLAKLGEGEYIPMPNKEIRAWLKKNNIEPPEDALITVEGKTQIRPGAKLNKEQELIAEWMVSCKGARDWNYRVGLYYFLWINDLLPSQAIELHRNWINNPKKYKKHPIVPLRQNFLNVFYRTSFEKDPTKRVAFKTIHSRDGAMRGFFTHITGVNLPKKQVKNIEECRIIRTPTRELTLEELGRLIDHADYRQKWILLFLVQSGLNQGDLAQLEYNQDIHDQIERGEKIIIFPYYREKSRDMGTRWSWFGYDALDAFLSYREKKGLRIGDPLFMGQNRRPLSGRQIYDIIRDVGRSAKIPLYPKMLRKYVSALMRDYGIDRDIIDLVTGHRMQDVAEAYTGMGRLRRAYMKIAKELNPYVQRVERQRSLEARIERLENTVNGLQETIQHFIVAFGNGKVKIPEFTQVVKQ